MIGLDTNVLVRYLAQDDPMQSAMATHLFEYDLSETNPGFLGLVVLVEAVWVLQRLYQATAEETGRDWLICSMHANWSLKTGQQSARRSRATKSPARILPMHSSHNLPRAALSSYTNAELADRDALLDSLRSGPHGFALDPLYEAPGRDDDPLLALRNVVITPHLAVQPRFKCAR